VSYVDLLAHSTRFVPAVHGVRMRCECCGYPTLGVVAFEDGTPDWESSVLGCLLCDWESAPALLDGTPDPEAPSDEARNEGYTLDAARANVARHAWMYDPARPEPWMVSPPTTVELTRRRTLRDAYEHQTAEPGPYLPWDDVFPAEAELRAAEARRADAAQDAWADHATDEDP
jgi:hypothetical protein